MLLRVSARSLTTGTESINEATNNLVVITGARLTETSDGTPYLRIEPRVEKGLTILESQDQGEELSTSKLGIKLQPVGATANFYGMEFVQDTATGKTHEWFLKPKLGSGLAFDEATGAIVVNGSSANLPRATTTAAGVVIVGNGIDVITATGATQGTISLKTASASQLGAIRVGTGLNIDGSGILSVSQTGLLTTSPASVNYVPKFTGNPLSLTNSRIQDDTLGVGIGGAGHANYILNVTGGIQTSGLSNFAGGVSSLSITLNPGAGNLAISQFSGRNSFIGSYGAVPNSASATLNAFSGSLARTGTHARLSLVEFAAPSIGGTTPGTSNAVTVYIDGAPSVAGANNYSLWVASGLSQFSGDAAFASKLTVGSDSWPSSGDGSVAPVRIAGVTNPTTLQKEALYASGNIWALGRVYANDFVLLDGTGSTASAGPQIKLFYNGAEFTSVLSTVRFTGPGVSVAHTGGLVGGDITVTVSGGTTGLAVFGQATNGYVPKFYDDAGTYKLANSLIYENAGAVTIGATLTVSGAASLAANSTVPTAAAGDNTTKIASTAYVRGEISALVASAPSTLDTLNELASALGNDPNFATTTATALGNRLRVDTNAQGLNATQRGNARTNLGLATSDAVTFGSVTATTFIGTLSGNASTADKLATARTISASGDLTWSVSFDGSAAVSAAATLATVNSNVGSFGASGTANTTPSTIPILTVNGKGLVTAVSTATVVAAANTLSGTTLATNVVNSSLTSVGVLTSLQVGTSIPAGTEVVRVGGSARIAGTVFANDFVLLDGTGSTASAGPAITLYGSSTYGGAQFAATTTLSTIRFTGSGVKIASYTGGDITLDISGGTAGLATSGTTTADFVPKFAGSSPLTLTNSAISDTGAGVSVASTLTVTGTIIGQGGVRTATPSGANAQEFFVPISGDNGIALGRTGPSYTNAALSWLPANRNYLYYNAASPLRVGSTSGYWEFNGAQYSTGSYLAIGDYSGGSTWNIRTSSARFVWGRSHDWTESFDLSLINGSYGADTGWAEFGQRSSNQASGTWRGVRIMRYTGSATVDGDLRAAKYYLGDDTNYLAQGNAGAIRSQTATGFVDMGSMNASYAHFQTDRPSFYFNKDVYVDGTLYKYGSTMYPYIHSNNIGSYAMPISGGTLTGTLNLHSSHGGNSGFINGTGDNATFASYNFALSGWFGMAFYNPTVGGAYPNQVSGVINFRDGVINMKGGFQVNGSAVLHAGNVSSYAPSLTGTGASGTWGINITGRAPAMFHTPTTSGVLDWNDVSNTRPGAGATLLLGTAANGMGGGTYYHPLNLEYASNDGTGNVTQMAVAYGTPANELYMRGRYAGAWSGWVRYLNSANYNSYSPTLTGGGASGNWGINITGNAATATTATTATTANATAQALTFSDAGTGAASGTTFNGGTARTISYNSVGAPSTGGANASGTWSINISGSAPAGSLTGATLASNVVNSSLTSVGTLTSLLVSGNTTMSGALTVNSSAQVYRLKFYGNGGNSGLSGDNYSIYQEAGAWASPFPDLVIQYHTGIKYDAYYVYGGHRFYTGYDGSGNPTGLTFSIGDGDQHVRVANSLFVGGGSPSASYKLDVNGNARVLGALYANDFVLLDGTGSTASAGPQIFVYNPSGGQVNSSPLSALRFTGAGVSGVSLTYGTGGDVTVTIAGGFSAPATATNNTLPKYSGTGTAATLTNSVISEASGTVTINGQLTVGTNTITAGTFSGSGASLTGIPISGVSGLQNALDNKAATSHTHTVSQISASGTPSASTYLRGDGTWATVTTNAGTVTSVSGSGGSTGLTLSGGPITASGTLTLGGTLAVASGGTGATDAATARSNLSAQAASAELSAIAGITTGTGFLKRTGSSTWALDTNTYLTGITSSQVTTALGYTPYNSTNPNGYISGISSSMVTTALGYTPYNSTNPNGYITSSGSISGNAATATTLQTARTINGVSFNGSANITITASSPGTLTISTGLTGTSYNGSGNVTIAIDSSVVTTNGSQTLANKTVYDTNYKVGGVRVETNTPAAFGSPAAAEGALWVVYA